VQGGALFVIGGHCGQTTLANDLSPRHLSHGKVGKDVYYGQSHWFWFNPLLSKGTPIEVTIDPQKPERSIVASWEI
jgi:hypothetical protein